MRSTRDRKKILSKIQPIQIKINDARHLRNSKQPVQALKILQPLLSSPSLNTEFIQAVKMEIIQCCIASQKLYLAEKTFYSIPETTLLDKFKPTYYLTAAFLFERIKNYPKALNALNQYPNQEDEVLSVHRATVYLAQNNYKEAKKHIDKLETSKKYANNYESLSEDWQCLSTNNPQLIVEFVQKLLNKPSNLKRALHHIEKTIPLLINNDNDKKLIDILITLLNQQKIKHPENPRPYLVLAKLYEHLSSFENTSEEYEILNQTYFEKTLEEYETLNQKFPNNFNKADKVRYAIYLSKSGDYEKSKEILLNITKQEDEQDLPSSRLLAKIHHGLAICYYGTKEKAKEKEAIKKAIEYDPTYAPGYSLLAKYCEATGAYDKAHCAYNNAMKLDPERFQRNHPLLQGSLSNINVNESKITLAEKNDAEFILTTNDFPDLSSTNQNEIKEEIIWDEEFINQTPTLPPSTDDQTPINVEIPNSWEDLAIESFDANSELTQTNLQQHAHVNSDLSPSSSIEEMKQPGLTLQTQNTENSTTFAEQKPEIEMVINDEKLNSINSSSNVDEYYHSSIGAGCVGEFVNSLFNFFAPKKSSETKNNFSPSSVLTNSK